MMKILLVNIVYNWGSTGYICRDIARQLTEKGNEVTIAAGFDWGEPKSGVFTFCTLIERAIYVKLNRLGLVSKFSGSPIATWRLKRFIKKTDPDVVHIHNINSNICNMYEIFKWLGKHGVKTVITHHAEILYTGNCNYSYDCNQWIDNKCRDCRNVIWATGSMFGNPHRSWKQMEESFSFFKSENVYFTAVSPWVECRAKLNTYLKNFRCKTVLNGIDTNIFRICEDFSELKNSVKIGYKDYVLYVSANFDPLNVNDIKGGYYLVKLAQIMPDVKFVVVATNISSTTFLPENVIIWGKAKTQEQLAMLYSGAMVTVLTSKKETFSMICAESLCCGTPIVGFLAGGPETIALNGCSKFVEHGNIDALCEAVNDMRNNRMNSLEISRVAQSVYSRATMSDNYEKIYNELLHQE